jgi:CRP/FNR family cyclic AMP-dependent transcriptional regulator
MVGHDTYDMIDSIAYYEDGEIIFAEGSHGDEMYVIHSGEVELSRTINNEEKVLTVLAKDSFFGEMALLSDTTRTATAIARGRTALLPFDKEAMVKRIENNPKFALHLITSLSERLMKTTSTLITLITAVKLHDDGQIQRMLSQDILH